MKETWISERRILQLPGLTIDRHLSKPNELDFSGCNYHLLCLLLSEGNRQKMTRIGEQKSEKPQRKGEFWLCPAQTAGLWSWASTDQSLMFVIDPLLLRQTAAELDGLDSNQVELLSAIGVCDPQIDAIAYLFQAELNNDNIGGQLYAESLTQLLMIHLLRKYCVLQLKAQCQPQSISQPRIQAVLDYIDNYLDRSLHLAELADVSGISQYYFCRLFKQAMGIAPYQYVLQKRMEKAKNLLQQRKHTIAEVAVLVGCTDQSRFTKHFKTYFGITPSLFLKQ